MAGFLLVSGRCCQAQLNQKKSASKNGKGHGIHAELRILHLQSASARKTTSRRTARRVRSPSLASTNRDWVGVGVGVEISGVTGDSTSSVFGWRVRPNLSIAEHVALSRILPPGRQPGKRALGSAPLIEGAWHRPSRTMQSAHRRGAFGPRPTPPHPWRSGSGWLVHANRGRSGRPCSTHIRCRGRPNAPDPTTPAPDRP